MPLGPNVGQNIKTLNEDNSIKAPANKRPRRQIQAIAIDAAKRKTGVGSDKKKRKR